MQSVLRTLLALWLGHAAVSGAETNLLDAFRARLRDHLAQSHFASAMWGVKVVSLDSGRTLFEENAGKLLKPASNAKLYTGALALDRLGPGYRIKTSLHATSRPDHGGLLRGDLIVYGRGDPSLAERFNNGDYAKILQPLVDALAGAGVKRIKGDLVGDESFFKGPPFGAQWTWDDLQQYYGAEASALTLQDNVVDLVIKPGARVGAPCRIVTLPATSYLSFSNRTVTMEAGVQPKISLYRPVGENTVYVSGWAALNGSNVVDAVSVHRPALWYAIMLKDALRARGIVVEGKPRAVDWLHRQIAPVDFKRLVELASVPSRPLSEILSRMLKPSQNLYAHLLLLQVGARNQKPASGAIETTEDLGLAEMKRFMAEAGIREGEVLLEEGSGLSRGALVTPNATIELLRFMHRHRFAVTFKECLPVAGVDGTLRNRMKGTPAFRNARAKTGTLRYVNTLSGYVTTAAGEQLVFSLMLNNYEGPGARAALDTIVVMLAELNAKA